MNKYFYALYFLLVNISLLNGQTIVFHEDFEPPSGADSVVAYSSSASNQWGISNNLYASGMQSDSAICSPYDTISLTTIAFDPGAGNQYIILEFDHICKIEALDIAIVEVSSDGGVSWTRLDSNHYMGNSSTFGPAGNVFNVTSYGGPWKSGQTQYIPDNSWWKHEMFDISSLAASSNNVKIRFSLIDANGTTLFENYGWFLDNIKITASASEMIPPVIVMSQPLIPDTVIFSLPQTVRAAITDNSGVDSAFVVYSINGVLHDTLGMVNTSANHYQADIPFAGFGRTITYFVEAVDNAAIPNRAVSNNYSYYLKYVPGALQNIALEEGFNGNSLPAGWTSTSSVWQHGTGQTSSSNTGPDGAYEGTGYVYTEASGHSNQTDELTSPVFDISNHVDPRLIFSYHMFGQAMGTLSVEIFDGNSWVQIWSKTGEQHNSVTDPWTRDTVYLQAYKNANAQIRFVGLTGSSFTSDMAVDFVQIGDPVTGVLNDAGISQLTNPTGGVVANSNFDVNVKVKNFGSNDLIKFDVDWQLDGVSKPSYTWTGALSPGSESNQITLGSETVPQGPHSLKIWTSHPNDTVDFNISNDTLHFNFFGCASLLNGNYTIGGSNPDYNNFSDAVLALSQCGISGAVSFDVAPGTYSEQISIPSINGASAVNNITFKSTANDSTQVVLQYDASSGGKNYVMELDGAAYLAFEQITFKSLGSSNSRVISIKDGAHDLDFTSNQFIGAAITAGGGGSDSALVVSTDTIGDNIDIKHNYFKNGTQGLNIIGQNLANIMVEYNVFRDQWSDALHVGGAVAPVIRNNYIETNSTHDDFSGLQLTEATGQFEVYANHILAPSTTVGYGLRLNNSLGDSLSHGRVYNNMILVNGALGTTTLSAGILNFNTGFTDYYFNTVKMTGDDQNTPAMCLYDMTSGISKGIEIKNNIFSNFANGYVLFTYNVDTSAYSSNYNNWYADGSGDYMQVSNSLVPDLAAWQNLYNHDANSSALDPYFPGGLDLHTSNNLLNNTGVPVAGITVDIDGDSRDANTPDMGADEFDASAYDLALIDYIAPLSECGLTSSENVTVKLKNVGSAVIDTLRLTYSVNNLSSAVFSDDVYIALNPGDTMVHTFSQTFDLDITWYGKDSIFEFRSWVFNTHDPIPNNDSITWQVNSMYEPPAPLVTDTSVNYGSSVTLTAFSNDSLYWFADDTTSQELHAGNGFTTPQLFDTTTYYVEARAAAGSPILITEFSSNPDDIEIQNITGDHVDATGWQVIICDGSNINNPVSATWILGTFAPYEIKMHGDSYGFPVNLAFASNDWIMIVDDKGKIRDFVVSDYSAAEIQNMSVTAGGFSGLNPVADNEWTGPGFTSSSTFFIRQYYDANDASDWVNAPTGSLNQPNPNMSKNPSFKASDCPSPRSPLNVYMNSYPALDAGITGIVNPSGSQPSGVSLPVKFTIHNYGQSSLSSADITWSVNGVVQNTYNWTGNLPFLATDTVTVGAMSFNGGVYDLQAWTSQPNGIADTINTNDTAYHTFNACMNGVYTIGNPSTGSYDFNSFNDALNALTTATVCGDVIFEVAPGTYYETVEIQEIPGVDAHNTVTFRSQNMDSTSVILEGAPQSIDEGVLSFVEGDYVTFSYMTIRVASTAPYAVAIYLDGQPEYNQVNNCLIESQFNTSSYSRCISTDGASANYNRFLNNHLKNGYYSIYWRGMSTSSRTRGVEFRNNIVEGFGYFGMYLYYQDSIIVKGNKLYNRLNSGITYGISAYYNFDGFEYANNEIILWGDGSSGTKYGFRLYYGNYYPYYTPSMKSGLVYNNIININSSSTKYGLYSYYSNDINFYYNTIKLSGSTGGTSRPLYQSNNLLNSIGETFLNNIFIDSVGDYAAYFATPGTIQNSDYNNYYTSGGMIAGWNGAQATLADLQLASGMDAHSNNVLPKFISHKNLRLDGFSLAGKGTPITEVPTDIDGIKRSDSATTPGAHEKHLVPVNVGVDKIISPSPTVNGNAKFPVQVVVRNDGTDPVSNFVVKYSLDGQGDVSQIYTQSLASMQKDTVTFADTLVIGGLHSICFNTVLAADTMPSNDQLCETFYADPEYDVGVSALIKPDSGICYTSAESVSLRITNYGYKILNLVKHPVTVYCEVDGPNPDTFGTVTLQSGALGPGDHKDVTVSNSYDMLQGGLYTFNAYTSMPGDGDSLNNAMPPQVLSVGGTINTFPYLETFESFDAGNGSSDPGDLKNGWSADPRLFSNDFQWYVNKGSTNTSSTGPDTDHTLGDDNGKYMHVDAQHSSFNQQAMLMTPCIDLGNLNNPVLRFWYHMYGANIYSLRVDVNNGNGWQNSVGFIIGDQQSSSSAPWEQMIVNLSKFAGDIVKIRFRAICGTGIYGDIAIDDVMIYEPNPVELGVKNIVTPTKEHASTGNLEPVELVVENLGLDTVKMFDVGFYSGSMNPVAETWTGSLSPFQDVTITMGSPYQVQKGNDPLKVFVSHPDDKNTSNDTAYHLLTGFSTEPIPYYDDFEGEDFWRQTGSSGQWERGQPAAQVINSPHSGKNVWAIDLDSNYGANSSDLLYSQYFDFSLVQGASLEFYHWYHSEQDHDGGFIQYTKTFGSAWQVLGNQNDPLGTNWYNSSNGAMPMWSGSSQGWVKSSYDLSQFDNSPSPVQFRFAYTTDAANSNYNGWALDDFAVVLAKIPADAGVVEIIEPSGYFNANGKNVTVRIRNFGTDVLNSIPVQFSVNGANTVSETWTGALQPGATVDYTFNTTLNVASGSAFELCAFTDVTGDSNTGNDQICKDFGLDAAVPYIMSPMLISYSSDSVALIIRLENAGSDTIFNTDVYYKVKNNPTVTEQWSGVLPPGKHVIYTFKQKFISPSGTYQVCAGPDLTGDTDPMNDEACKHITGKQKDDVSINEKSGNPDFAIADCYPNPAGELVNIPVELGKPGVLNFELYNITGEKILQRSHILPFGENIIQLNVKDLAQGMYYFKLSSAHGSVAAKIIVSR